MGKAISRPVQPVHRHLFIVTGPAGCGKSSVAQYLAKTQDFQYIEGDEVMLSIQKISFSPFNPQSSFTQFPMLRKWLLEFL